MPPPTREHPPVSRAIEALQQQPDGGRMKMRNALIAAMAIAVVSGRGNSEGLSTRSAADTAPSTCERTDPVGDASIRDQAFEIAPYQDIVKASITRLDSSFMLEMDVAAPIPDSPVLGRGVHLLDWTF